MRYCYIAQNLGSRDPGSRGRFCQVRKVSPQKHALCHELPDYQKNIPRMVLFKQVMKVSYIKLCFQESLSTFYFHIFWEIWHIHLIDFAARITLN